MKQLFEFLYPQRTHLKAVIAALLAVFMLSGVLAWQVLRSERARAAMQERQLTGHAVTAAEELAIRTTINGSQQIEGIFGAAAASVFKGGTLDDGAKLLTPHIMCFECGVPNGGAAVSVVQHANDSSALDGALLRQVGSAAWAPLGRGWRFGAFVTEAVGEPKLIAFAIDSVTTSGWVITYPAAIASSTLQLIANSAELISDRLIAPVEPESANHTVFRIDATAPHLRTVSTTGDSMATNISTVIQSGHILPGTVWQVGVLPRGRDVLAPPSSKLLTPTLLMLVMVLIAGVIAMAIVVVRREEELHRLRSDLISGVSHELRTPLAQIRMFAETLLLGRTRTEAERRRSLEVIDQEAKRLSHFVDNMLQFAKGEGGRARLAPEHSSFAVEIRRSIDSFAPMCQARGVQVRAELEEGVTAPVDRAALRQIMLNLVDNALKYGPDAQRITVGTALFNDAVRVWVDDEGQGIPRADRERVFDSFYRLNRDLERRVTGSGIGLAVVRQLAVLHGGKAWAEEAPGGGARIVVEFPGGYVRAPEQEADWAVA